jgi:hypothetical protein
MKKSIVYISLIFLIVLFGAASCRVSLLLNGERALYLSQENVKVRLTVEALNTMRIISVEVILGDIRVNTDELKLIPPPFQNIEPTFHSDSKAVTGIFDVKQGSGFVCWFTGAAAEILILPSDFIMHNGKPLITDTIRITSRR